MKAPRQSFWTRRKKIVAVVVLLCAVTLTVFLWLQKRNSATPVTTTPTATAPATPATPPDPNAVPLHKRIAEIIAEHGMIRHEARKSLDGKLRASLKQELDPNYVSGLTNDVVGVLASDHDGELVVLRHQIEDPNAELDLAFGTDPLYAKWLPLRQGKNPLVEVDPNEILKHHENLKIAQAKLELGDLRRVREAKTLVEAAREFLTTGNGGRYLRQLEEAKNLLAEARRIRVPAGTVPATERAGAADLAKAKAEEEKRQAALRIPHEIQLPYPLSSDPSVVTTTLWKVIDEWDAETVKRAAGDLKLEPQQRVEHFMLFRAYVHTLTGWKISPKDPQYREDLEKMARIWLLFCEYSRYAEHPKLGDPRVNPYTRWGKISSPEEQKRRAEYWYGAEKAMMWSVIRSIVDPNYAP